MCFALVPIFSQAFKNNIIHLDSLLLLFDGLWKVKGEYIV